MLNLGRFLHPAGCFPLTAMCNWVKAEWDEGGVRKVMRKSEGKEGNTYNYDPSLFRKPSQSVFGWVARAQTYFYLFNFVEPDESWVGVARMHSA
ncbi:hypothetical protein CDAR_109501 [Caerostris darwini]|uniref:Uncharacterized protein n=1 Tax=Caerostris darwini TaxID=1538125 RepID=A0AAV4TX94_9ARAC|nr:hypothetical protein CDAR_109501 [Caerostris darwini]